MPDIGVPVSVPRIKGRAVTGTGLWLGQPNGVRPLIVGSGAWPQWWCSPGLRSRRDALTVQRKQLSKQDRIQKVSNEDPRGCFSGTLAGTSVSLRGLRTSLRARQRVGGPERWLTGPECQQHRFTAPD